MKNQSPNDLREELKLAGASDTETNELAVIASKIKQLKNFESPLPKSALPDLRKSKWTRLLPFGLTSITGLTLGMALVIFSQTVLPSSWLYPVQKLSDNVAMTLNSDYKGTVMMKRAQEVKQLIAEHASSNLVLATLADYQVEASTYKTVSANYAVFEYCKANLQQASSVAPGPERQAINNALLSLQNV
jgi:hypothetical protein